MGRARRLRLGVLLPAALAAFGTRPAPAEWREGAIAFRRVPMPEEVPSAIVTSLAQDRSGFLWIGTQGGLVRYDGYEFRVHRPIADDPTSLGGAYVRALLAATDGRLWVGTFTDGVSVWDPATETFTRYRRDGGPSSLSHDRVEGLAEDRAGRIWIATSEGLDCLDPKSKRVERFRHREGDAESLADDRVRGLLVDSKGVLWVGTRHGLQRWNAATARFESVASEPGDPGSLAGDLVNHIAEDASGRLWIGTTERGAAVLDPASGTLRRLLPQPGAPQGLSHFWVYGFAPATPREMWIATFGGGIDVVDVETLRIVDRLRADAAVEDTIGGDRVGALLRDRSGLVWVGAWGQGLARHDPSARAFRAIRHSPTRPEGLSHPAAVRALEAPDGRIWIGTNGTGVDVLDLERGFTERLRPRLADPGALADGAVTALARGPDGSMWVATLSGHLHRRREGASRFERLGPDNGLPGGPIRCLTFGPDGALWAGASEGLARIDPSKRPASVRSYRHRPDDRSSLSGLAVEAIAFTPDDTMWVGTDSGLNVFDPGTGRAIRILADPSRPDALPANWVPDLLVTRGGRLWVGTSGGATILESWDGRAARFESLAARLHRPPVPAESLVEDGEGRIWVGPRLRVDPGTFRVRDFGTDDGVSFGSFFIASRARSHDGTLLFGSPEGLLLVRPGAIRPWTFEPPLATSSLFVAGAPRAGASRLEALVLSPTERSFQLGLASLDFSAPSRLVYRHKLEGLDPEWTREDAARRTITYTNLPPGDFVLRLQGSNRVGTFAAERRIAVTVRPAFHQTTPFRAAAAFLAALAAFGLYRLRVRALRVRGRQLERLVAERTAALDERGRQLSRAHEELQAAYVRIEEASLTDPLTGLRNRRFLESALQADADLAARRTPAAGSEGADLVFVLVDLDHFKDVNDTRGHAAGDAVLVQAASRIRHAVRSSDYVVRWGGEEFLVVARFVDRRRAVDLAEKVREVISTAPFVLPDGSSLVKTASAGVASFPFSSDDPRAGSWEQVVHVADLGLYAAKRGGRDRTSGYGPADGAAAAEALARLSADPDRAIAEGWALPLGPAS